MKQMFRYTTALLAALLLIVPALAQEEISPGDTVTGSVEAGTVDYKLVLNAGEIVQIDLTSDDFDAYLIVSDADGNSVVENDDGGEGRNASLTLNTLAEGRYTITVRAFGGDATGDFTLTANSVQPKPLTVGEPEAAEATEGVLLRSVTLEAGQCVVVQFVSSDFFGFDPIITLYSPDGESVMEDDDGGDGVNSYGLHCAETSGDYLLQASALYGAVSEAYRLEVMPASGIAVVGPDETVFADGNATGTLTDNRSEQTFSADLSAGTSIIVTQGSDDFDTRLSLLLDGVVLAENDDFFGTDSQINYVVPVDGTYDIVASSFAGNGSGSFELRLLDAPAIIRSESFASSDQGSISVGQTVEGVLERERHNYTLTAESAGVTLLISQKSDEIDTYLRVLNAAGGEIAANDDGGEGTDSEIELTLSYVGDYTIVAGSYADSDDGPYTLSIEVRP
jgi:plastocyanin